MADNAEVVFKFIDGGSSKEGGSAGGSGTPKDSTRAEDAIKKTPATEAAKKPPVITTPPNQERSVLAKVGDSIREAIKGTRAGSVVEGGMAAGRAIGSTTATGATKAITALGAAAAPIGVAVGALGVLGLAAKKASNALREIAGEVGQYSGEFQAAKANNRAQKTLQDVERAQRFGARMARQEEVDGKMDRALTELSDDFTEFFAPLGDMYTEIKNSFAEAIGWLAGIDSKLDKQKNPHKAVSMLQQKFKELGSIEGRLKFLNDKFANRSIGGEFAGDVGYKDLVGIPFEGAN